MSSYSVNHTTVMVKTLVNLANSTQFAKNFCQYSPKIFAGYAHEFVILTYGT